MQRNSVDYAQPEQFALERIYRSLRLIRRAEEEIARVYPSDKIKSPVHLSIGQEAVAVGVCDVLEPDDVVSPTYRGHAAYLAKGASLRGLFAELYGKATGVARGKGGSMHLIDMTHNVLGASAVVGTTIPLAVGFALAFKRTQEPARGRGVFWRRRDRGGRVHRKPELRRLTQVADPVRLREQFLRDPHAGDAALGNAAPLRTRRDLRYSGALRRGRRCVEAT